LAKANYQGNNFDGEFANFDQGFYEGGCGNQIFGYGGNPITTDVVTMEVEEGGGTSSLQKMIVSRMVKKMRLWDPIMVLKRILVPGRPWLH
jgi:hypothetical protein